MRRLASVLAVAIVALCAATARAEPLDVDLSRLGAPDPAVWVALGDSLAPGSIPQATAEEYARGAKERFAVLSSEVALALSSALLEPASTTGYAGFDFALEGSYTPVHSDARGTAPSGSPYGTAYATTPWPTRFEQPASLTTTGLHVRKALPFSFELGGRLIYLNKSSYMAAQGEAKWALNEGSDVIPDFGVRVAHTRLFGQREWNLGATDLDFMVSKRWGVNGVTSFTPYLAARFTFVTASTEQLDFGGDLAGPAPADRYPAVAAFPRLRVGLYRTTLGVRMTASVVSLAAEVTYFGGKSYSGEDGVPLSAGDYGDFSVPSSFAGAGKLGWEF
jgi:hypothetical protein